LLASGSKQQRFARRLDQAHPPQPDADLVSTRAVLVHQGFDLPSTQYDERWRATFYTTGMEHSPTSATGTGWERTPWHATQRAACAGL
jgi:hypothetical protein